MSMDTAAARSSRPAARCVRTEVRWRWARRGPRRAEDTSRCLGGAADRPHHAGLRGRGHLQPNRTSHISGRSQDGKALHLTGPPVLQRAARCAHGVAMDARLRPWQIWGSAGVNSPCAAAIIMAAARSRARSELWKTADEPSKMHAFYTSVTIRNFRRGNVGGNNTVSPARSICIKLHPDR